MPASTSPPREQIVIVGGGIAALTAAHHLSRTPELRRRYAVTVYQMGWRLGGKLASGRNPDAGMRNEEHGLHVWFGFYDNAFALAREIYERWASPDGCPFETWRDVLEPQSFTPIGDFVDGEWLWYPIEWPVNSDVPGFGGVGLSFGGALTQFLSTLARVFDALLEELEMDLLGRIDVIPDALEDWVGGVIESLTGRPSAHHPSSTPRLLRHALELAESIELPDDDDDGVPDALADTARALDEILAALARLLRTVADAHADPGTLAWQMFAALDVGLAVARGVLDPANGILIDGNLDRIDGEELRPWLKRYGADPTIVDTWSGLRALYDTAFQYVDGDTARPDFAAGTAIRVVFRIMLTYKGAVLWLIRSGMGECIIAPLYEILRDQGVEFRFFHELTDMELSDDGNVLSKLVFDRQVDLVDETYEPLTDCRGLRVWPSEPFWGQIEDGAAQRDAGVNWESPWNDWPVAGQVELVHGVDFDRCILGIPLGAFKRLNDEDTPLAESLIERKPAFGAMTEQLGLAPNCGAQLWMNRTLEELGWRDPRPAMVAWAYPVDIWTDMTPVIETEDWPRGREPRSTHYLCGAFGSELYRAPSSATDTRQIAHQQLRDQVISQLETVAGSIWPEATTPDGAGLDWDVLYADESLSGVDRLDAQYLRANVAPSECIVGSRTGTTRYRLDADESGVTNLLLCGAWTRTGINASCVEGAVMSGMKAARALTGQPLDVVGEDFLGPPRRATGVARHARAPLSTEPPLPSGGPAMTDYPPYETTLGHGQQSVLPPGIVKDARVYVFAIRIDSRRTEDFVNRRLAGPTLGDLEYKVLGDIALVAFLDGAQLTSTAVNMGWLRDRECAVSLILAEKRHDSDEPCLVGWMPYIFVDTSIAMATGREIWGFPKEMGDITVPALGGSPDRFEATARVFDTLERDTQGVVKPIVTVERQVGSGPLSSAWETTEDVVDWFVDEITNSGGHLWHWDDAVELAVDAAELAAKRSTRVVNLKQFRDVEFPDRACYQAIVHSLFEFTEVKRGGLLHGDYRMEIADVQSHQIIGDLGLPGTDNDVVFGLWVDVEFRIPPGKVVWPDDA